jgi:hypothetical protein
LIHAEDGSVEPISMEPTWIERVYARVASLTPEMADREVVVRLLAAIALAPIVVSVVLLRNYLWKNSSN